MSILIKGMEMPEKCAVCKMWSICDCLNDFEDYVSIMDAVEDGFLVRDNNCPLVEVPEPHWIPVTERLPKSAEDDLEYPTVLVCFDNGDVDTACFYESTREWGCGDMYDRICHPTAWMPLPLPYKAEGSEE